MEWEQERGVEWIDRSNWLIVSQNNIRFGVLGFYEVLWVSVWHGIWSDVATQNELFG